MKGAVGVSDQLSTPGEDLPWKQDVSRGSAQISRRIFKLA